MTNYGGNLRRIRKTSTVTNFIIKTFEKTKKIGRNLVNIKSKDENKIYTNNPTQEYLFMGGSKDGRCMAIPDNEWKVVIPRPFLGGLSKEIYSKIILCTPKTRLAIYVSEGFSELDILDVLVENYKEQIYSI